MLLSSALTGVLAARGIGRAIGNLIEGIQNGDPMAIGISVVLLVVGLGLLYFRFAGGGEASDE
ncbi:hypothetical protein [Calycomorphotria hydatis]|uniref:Uncharacterized protein n=1 Tax=Calycomorphotria hydatis TaxID=2528027 RepID=A0A517T4T2_9PLAN|nr:hypothetical protein [Calycomorphotria hydatis]QDT63380.1 hypothetical protein V22_06010 [Calycomorphotria hydatis]